MISTSILLIVAGLCLLVLWAVVAELNLHKQHSGIDKKYPVKLLTGLAIFIVVLIVWTLILNKNNDFPFRP